MNYLKRNLNQCCINYSCHRWKPIVTNSASLHTTAGVPNRYLIIYAYWNIYKINWKKNLSDEVVSRLKHNLVAVFCITRILLSNNTVFWLFNLIFPTLLNIVSKIVHLNFSFSRKFHRILQYFFLIHDTFNYLANLQNL